MLELINIRLAIFFYILYCDKLILSFVGHGDYWGGGSETTSTPGDDFFVMSDDRYELTDDELTELLSDL